MDKTVTALAAAVAAMLIIGGLILFAVSLIPVPVTAQPARTTTTIRRRLAGAATGSSRTRTLAVLGLAAGVAAWLASGWIIALIVLPAAFAGLPLLLTGHNETAIDRLQAMEDWTRNLCGTLGTGAGIEQALIASLRSTPAPIRPEVATLIARLRAGWMANDALRAFADDLDDATGDLIAASLLLGVDERGEGLTAVLNGLAATVADDVKMRRTVDAERDSPRKTARWITIITVGVLALLAVEGDYVQPYRRGDGQIVLLTLLTAYAATLFWMRQIARDPHLPRFLGKRAASQRGGTE